MGDVQTRIWRNAYLSAFVIYAMARCWTHENAAEWAGEIVDEALLAYPRDTSPEDAARADVVECEWEAEAAA